MDSCAFIEDWVLPRLCARWNAPGSVGEQENPRITRAWFSSILHAGNYSIIFDNDYEVTGFAAWLWIDDTGMDLVKRHGGLLQVIQAGTTLNEGKNALLTHLIADDHIIYRRVLRAVWDKVKPGNCICSFKKHSDEFKKWVKK